MDTPKLNPEKRLQFIQEHVLRLKAHKLFLEIEALQENAANPFKHAKETAAAEVAVGAAQYDAERLQERVYDLNIALGSLVAKLLDAPPENLVNLEYDDLIKEAGRVEAKVKPLPVWEIKRPSS